LADALRREPIEPVIHDVEVVVAEPPLAEAVDESEGIYAMQQPSNARDFPRQRQKLARSEKKREPRTFRETALRHFHQNIRRKSPHMLVGSFLLCVPLWLEAFGAGLPLAAKLAIGIFCGAVAGLLFYPDPRYSLIGVLCGALAGTSSAIALHCYALGIPPPTPVKARELFVVWLLCFASFFALYYLLMRWAILGNAFTKISASPGDSATREPNDVWFAPPKWRHALASVVFLGLALLGFLLAGREESLLVRRVLWIGMGLFFSGAAVVALFIRTRKSERDVELYPRAMRGRWRGLRHAFPLLGAVGGVWCVLVTVSLFFPINTPVPMLALVFPLPVALIGYIWYSVVRVQNGLGWPPIMILSYYRYPIQAAPHLWMKPTLYARPFFLALFGCSLLPATIGVFLLKERVGDSLSPVPPQPVHMENEKNSAPTHTVFEFGPRDYLSDLEPFDVHPGPWPIATNGKIGYEARDISVGGAPSPKGMGMHPPESPHFASVKFHLDKKAAVFKAKGAVNDTDLFVPGRAVFEVLGDNRPLWKSVPVAKGEKPQECNVDVGGIDVLELRTRAEGGNFGVNAVWIEPRLLQKPDTPDP
jgi:hypothetical protein